MPNQIDVGYVMSCDTEINDLSEAYTGTCTCRYQNGDVNGNNWLVHVNGKGKYSLVWVAPLLNMICAQCDLCHIYMQTLLL